ncbi:hypothetical protein BCR41DRAFT_44520 [Lobosporangium transversale]|uniref:Uncharacterized protein n=1 Tax=Lobosporangium transversale TaxID=64571 RepID=A0A1Y2GRB8_9FUNG|nr:hypothetical protein BCR41DRAFT_44520 [Lobosporangium transversale]ORZ18283.1 hypothetical protein BCR41DRAFT_44520 [Lobosporangium transversale]|eukprot:XP_021882078.1 hypothetical protein BCR41DRAFT_44520 [Lobosporangium transversale]
MRHERNIKSTSVAFMVVVGVTSHILFFYKSVFTKSDECSHNITKLRLFYFRSVLLVLGSARLNALSSSTLCPLWINSIFPVYHQDQRLSWSKVDYIYTFVFIFLLQMNKGLLLLSFFFFSSFSFLFFVL